jgi:thymidylate synthase
MAIWFELEAEIRKNPNNAPRLSDHVGDQFMRASLEMARLYNGAAAGWDGPQIVDELSEMKTTDLAVAAYEYYARKHPQILDRIPDSSLSEFFARYNDHGGSAGAASGKQLLTQIKSLHTRKDEAYGCSWKKRGELTSILANIARKVDRLDEYNHSGAELAEESVLDTAVDLLVYSAKYVLFLLEQPGVCWEDQLPKGSPVPFSDHVVNFNWQLDHMPKSGLGNFSVKEIISLITSTFEEMHRRAIVNAAVAARITSAVNLRDISFALVETLYRLDPQKLASVR